MRKTNPFYLGEWYVQPALNRMAGPEGEVQVEPKLMEVLTCLADRPGEVVSREELFEVAWDDVLVVDKALTRVISELRKALGDSPTRSRYIETIPKRGYRLVAPVRASNGDERAPAVNPVPPLMAGEQRHRTWWAALAVGALGVIAGVVGWVFQAESPLSPNRLRTSPVTSAEGAETSSRLSPDGNRIVFAWAGPTGENWDIYVKQQGSADALRLTDSPDVDFGPAWSPDGTQIVFVRYGYGGDCSLFITSTLRGTERRLAPCEHLVNSPLDWSPDGQWIVYSGVDPERMEPAALYLLSVETGERRRLTTSQRDGARGNVRPRFSPDGRWLAFARQYDLVSDLYLIDLETGRERQLTRGERVLKGHDWVPDGSALIYSSNRDGAYSLWTLPLSGGPSQRMPIDGWNAMYPSVARTQPRLTYERWHYDADIWQLSLTGSDTSQSAAPLISSTYLDFSPSYAPDGNHLAFVSNRSGSFELWKGTSRGEQLVQLTDFGKAMVSSPAWSPDGTRLAFEAHADGASDLYVIDASGGIPRQVTTAPGSEVLPHWSRDGRWIYYNVRRGNRMEIWKASLSGGPPVLVLKDGGHKPQESPDGRFLYFLRREGQPLRDEFWRVPIQGGSPRLIDKDQSVCGFLNWMPTNDGVYLSRRCGNVSFLTSDGHVMDVKDVDDVSRQCEYWFEHFLTGMAISADGQHALYTFSESPESDIMLVEGF